MNAYVDLPDGFNDFTTGISVAAWVKTSSFGNYTRVIGFGNGAGVDTIVFARRGTGSDVHIAVDGGIAPGARDFIIGNVFKMDEWQHLVNTIDDDVTHTSKFYLDGVEIGSDSTALPGNVTRVNNYIGKSNGKRDRYRHRRARRGRRS